MPKKDFENPGRGQGSKTDAPGAPAGNGRQALLGGDGDDIMRGGNGPDVLSGGGGADILSGGRGPDTLTGGEGADVFLYGRGFGPDTITDFTVGEDTIRVIIPGIDGFEDVVLTEKKGSVIVSFRAVAGEDPTPEEPVSEEPVTEDPATDEPDADGSGTDDPPAEDEETGSGVDVSAMEIDDGDTTDDSTDDDPVVDDGADDEASEDEMPEDEVSEDEAPEDDDGDSDDEDAGGGRLILEGVSLDDLTAESFAFGLPKASETDEDDEGAENEDAPAEDEDALAEDEDTFGDFLSDDEAPALTASTTSGDDHITGLEGLDVVRFGKGKGHYKVKREDDTVTITSDDEGEDVLEDVERVEFSDGMLAFDVEGAAGQAFRLYRAAFDREPDQSGLGYWIRELDRGQSLRDIANSFLRSEEFQSTYGADVGDEAFVTMLYQNILDRAPDSEGLGYWLSDLANGSERQDVLSGFSESTENKTAVAPSVDDGIFYV